MKHLFLCLTLLFSPVTQADNVIARGQFGEFTRDNALALYEATVFCLQQVGQPQMLANVSPEQAIAAYAQAYPIADAETQVALTHARQSWQQTRQQWQYLSMDQKRAFALDVLTLSFGDQTARQLLGMPAGGTGGDSSGTAGLPSLDQGYEGSDCWGSAGCSGYDSGSGYTYDSYDGGY